MNKTPEVANQKTEVRGIGSRHLLACALWLLTSSALRAQSINPQSLYGRDTTQGVYVRDSAVAVEKLALAERMQRLREWDTAAGIYQEILRDYGDRVVPSQIDAENRIYQYTSVVPAVQERMSKWPAEGLSAYRARYEAEAAAMVESAGDEPAQLHRALSLHFVTESAKRGAIRLIDLYLERGEFAAAAWLGDRLLALHPTLAAERPKVLYRVALAYHLAGNEDLAQARLHELKQNHPDALDRVRGSDVILAESLAQELAAGDAQRGEQSSDSWPTAFGSADRSRVGLAGSFGGANLIDIELASPPARAIPPPARREFEQQSQRDRAMGLMTGIFPVVDRGELFFHDNANVYAVDLESGHPLPGWAQTYPGPRNGRYSIGGWPTPRSHQCTLTITEDAVLAVMGQPDLIVMQHTGTFGQRNTRLVCLDRRTGRQRWIAAPSQFPEAQAALRDLDLFGSPLVVGQSVYLQARGNKGGQFEDSYVLAFDLNSGKLKWACYVASANTGMQFWDSDLGAILAQNVSHLAYFSGRVYALTNLGALAAIDAYEGTIVWLDVYPRDVPDLTRALGLANWNRARSARGAGSEKPWTHNPVVVSQTRVFILPSDGAHVHIYDAGSGVELKRINLGQFDNARALLTVVDEKLVVASQRRVFCINWPAYDGSRPARANLIWATNSLEREGILDDAIRGRPFVTADSVIVPTAWQLVRVSLRNGLILDTYPPGYQASWAQGEEPGNVLATPDRLIVAGPNRVAVYTDFALAASKLDADIAAAPHDPTPRLRYAEVLFAARKPEAAAARMDEAIDLMGGPASMPTGATRDRIFATSLAFAQKLQQENAPNAAELADAFYDRAAAAAATCPQKAEYCLSRAAFARKILRPDQELRLYQDILADGEMRVIAVSVGDGDTVLAADLARRRIDQLIIRAGASVYEPIEREAVAMFQSASSFADPLKLRSVAMTYPNSSVAPAALLAAAELWEQAGNLRQAAQVLRQAYLQYPGAAQRAELVEALVRCYLAMPGRVDVAVARLEQEARLSPRARLSQPLILPDRRRIEAMSFAEAAAALRQVQSSAGVAREPDIALPHLPPVNQRRGRIAAFVTQEQQIPGVSALVAPKNGVVRHDRVVTFTAGAGVRVFVSGGAQPLWTSEATAQQPAGAAWAEAGLLIWTEDEAALLENDTGRVIWKFSIRSLPQTEVVPTVQAPDEAARRGPHDQPPRDPEPRAFDVGGRRIVVHPGGQLIIRGAGRVRIVAAAAAAPAAETPPAPPVEQVSHVQVLSDRVIVTTSSGRVIALDLLDGAPLWQTQLADSITHLSAMDEFVAMRLVGAGGGSVVLVALDAVSGQVISRRSFIAEGGAGQVPVNLALSPAGILVYLLPDRICGKDLFEAGGLDRLSYDQPGRGGESGAAPFATSSGPDDLQIVGDRVLVLSDAGAYVRAYSAGNGQLLRFGEGEAVLPTGAPGGAAHVMMRAGGNKLYVIAPREIHGYDLLDPSQSWTSRISVRTPVAVRDLIVCRGHVVAITEPAGPRGQQPRNAPTPSMQLKAFSRATDASGKESGVFEHDVEVKDNAAIVAWQIADGGFWYLTGDKKLHWLHGARNP